MEKNIYPPYLIDKQTKLFLNNNLSEIDKPKENYNKGIMTCHKLPYIGDISVKTKEKSFSKDFAKKLTFNIALILFNIASLLSSKERIPNALRYFVVYKLTCAGCQSYYIGETKRHLAARIKDHLVTDKKSHIMKHVLDNKICKCLCDEDCFQVIDYASSLFRLKVKEALHIN